MDKMKCITFDPAAQKELPDHIKAKMETVKAINHAQLDKELYLRHIIRNGDKTYFVKFYDNDKKLLVHADNFIKAGILAMAYIILKDGVGFGIEYVEDLSGMKVPVYINNEI
ncbi:hypothetical protein [Parabacteroides johnsonii]|uniref:hypothetical protein n=1 Tax=Parabacteroides johnsonii TaxID=387661 RepID=UPI00242D5E85|nr:hypothetical protein [Parabacteroides johnsonii]